MSRVLCITRFQNVDKMINFAETFFPKDIKAIDSMRKIDVELNENKKWLCMIGVCDICGEEGINFMPACIFDNGISGVECPNCRNMSVYPKEEDNE